MILETLGMVLETMGIVFETLGMILETLGMVICRSFHNKINVLSLHRIIIRIITQSMIYRREAP